MPPNFTVTVVIADRRGQETEVQLPPGTYLIGRAAECQITLSSADKTVSRQHAQLLIDGDRVIIEDLESRAGTTVNGQIISRAELENDDVITISTFRLAVRIPQTEKVVEHLYVANDQAGVERAENLDAALAEVAETSRKVAAEVAKRIIGQEDVVRMVWATILANSHCLLIGVPGLAKTFLVNTFSSVLGLSTKRIQFTPDLMPSDIIGSNVIVESGDGRRTFEFVQGPVFCQLLLADEINRTPPKTQAALLEAMQERQVTVGTKSYTLSSPFCVIASQNPIEQEGTYPLPEAQQDRFMLCLHLDYPNRDDEIDVVVRTTKGIVEPVSEILNANTILRFQQLVNQIAVPRELAAYAVDVVRATRPDSETAEDWLKTTIEWGAGPRAGQAIIRTAKALAAIDGRPSVSVIDMQTAMKPVLRHRIACSFKARANGLTEDKIIERICSETKLP